MNLEKKYSALSYTLEVAELSLKEIFSFSPKTILYFYPKDNTPWCSTEAKDFTCLKSEYKKLWIQIVWVSKDSIQSHKEFINDLSLEIDLISDPELILHKELWVYWEKNNYWKIITWVIRSTFLVSNNWDILKEWRNVKATWHAEKVLRELNI